MINTKKEVKYIFTLLYICYILSFNLNAQSEWIGNVISNKDRFEPNNDTIIISIDIFKDGFTQYDEKNEELKCTIHIFSPWSQSENDFSRNDFQYEMNFDKRIEDKHRYFISLPSALLKNGRYFFEFNATVDEWNNIFSFSLEDNPHMKISVGNYGFVSIYSQISINDNIFNYSILDFDKEQIFLPEYLEGIYSKGFCYDEYISIDEFNILAWSLYPQDEIKIETYYSIDGGNYTKFEKFSIEDDSKDGKLSFNDETYNYLFKDNTTVDYSIKFKTEIKDILKKIIISSETEHEIEFYFKIMNDKSESRFPESGNIKLKFRVVNTPTGADCQAALLPIDILDWYAVKREKSVHLKWTTASETNNEYFEIERSTDLNTWKALFKIQGHGYSQETHNYNAIDNYPLLGENYYRLKQTDFDGTNKYSRVLIIKNYENELVLFPNPVKDILSYKVTDPSKQFSIEIFNSSGQLVELHKVPEPLKNDNQLNLNHLKKGIYFLKYINVQNHQSKILKLIKL